jgi:hypothetical protein
MAEKKASDVKFSVESMDGGKWQVVITFPEGELDRIPNFTSEEAAQKWIAERGAGSWLQVRGYA